MNDTDKIWNEAKVEIKEYDKGNPMVYLEIRGYSYRFSVQGFPAEHIEWLKEILLTSFRRCDQRAFLDGQTDVRVKLMEAIGLR